VRERKVITVLFADLVGFTSTAEELDPEDVEAILRPYHERLRFELERWGGTVEKFIGDAVVAFFGAPVAGENDPERAVRAALAIRDWISEEGKLQVRIAVNTGEALVNLAARPESGEGMASGDVVNTTARLQSAAPTNGIVVGETTYRATAETIEYREHEPVEAKGKAEPVPVWEVAQARARFGVDLAPERRTALVGRERELQLLVGTLQRARHQRSLELVTLVGVAGMGKSRLVGELFRSIDSAGELTYWRQGRSLPYGEGVSYWALAEMVKAQAGILETDRDDEVAAKLGRTVEQLLDEDAEWVLSHLLPLVGQTDEAAGSQEEAFAAWRRFFEALAEEHALVLVFEDIQWADDGLLAFVEHLVDWVRGVPMLILCTARMELLERRPAWGGGKLNAANVALAPLSSDETAQLIAALNDRPLLEAEMQAELLDRAGGNPLYAEQYVRMLTERGTAEALPETVQGIIAARLDGLPADEKSVLQDAAVMGKVFWLGVLGVGEQQLHALQQKDFVQRARRSSVEGEIEYAFTHVLVRDVAYSQIPRADRAQKHLHAAEWIESLGRPEDHAEMLAHHYSGTLALSRAAGHHVDDLIPRVRSALRDAGDRAAALNAWVQAEDYYAQALELAGEDDTEKGDLLLRLGRIRYFREETGEEMLAEAQERLVRAGARDPAAEAALMRADIAWQNGDSDTMRQRFGEARALIAGQPPSPVQAAILSEISRYEMVSDQNDAAIEHGLEALRVAEQLGLDDLRSQVLNTIGSARTAIGDARGFNDLQESIAVARSANAVSALIRATNNLGTMRVVYGQLREAWADLDETLRLAEHYGDGGMARWIRGGAKPGMAYNQGRWDESLAFAEAFIGSLEGSHYQAPSSYNFRGLIRLGRGDHEGAVADAAIALDLARRIQDPQALQPTFAMSAHTYLVAGDEGRARETLDEAIDGLRPLGALGFVGVELHLVMWVANVLGHEEKEVLAAADRDPVQSVWLEVVRALAAGELVRAADLLDGIGSRTHAAFYRLQSGAEQDVRAAVAFFRGAGATRYVQDGEALLAASA
jgi:class 3 adenylate cyclase/tetratricopeptide (TPR) repeat protein